VIADSEAQAWINAYGEAWITQDPDRIVRLFSPGALYRERRFHKGISGRDAIRDYWKLIVHELQRDVGFTVEQVIVAGDQAFIHWRSHFTWRPINGILELDAMSRISFAPADGPGLRQADAFEEWIDSREG
jgi:ketosteroid isomerase-like protein